MGSPCRTQKTYKNLAKTNKNWSGGRLGVLWGVHVKLKKHTKTCVTPSKIGLGVVLGSYGIIFGVLVAHLGVIWVHFGDENSTNIQKPG